MTLVWATNSGRYCALGADGHVRAEPQLAAGVLSPRGGVGVGIRGGGDDPAVTLYSFPVFGTGETELWSYTGDIAGAPAWNPAGTELALTIAPPFTTAAFGRLPPVAPPGLWVVGADGSHPHRIATDASGTVTWSPDGAHLAYESAGRSRQGGPAVAVETVSAHGGTPHRIGTADDAGSSNALSWAPDGRTVLVSTPAGSGGFGSIEALPVDGGGARVLLQGTRSLSYVDAAYSPDGQHIAVGTRAFSGTTSLLLTDADGSHPVTLSQQTDGGNWIPTVDLPSGSGSATLPRAPVAPGGAGEAVAPSPTSTTIPAGQGPC